MKLTPEQLDKYINGFEEGIFSYDHPDPLNYGYTFSNIICGEPELSEASLDLAKNHMQALGGKGKFSMYCNPNNPFINKRVLYERIKTQTKIVETLMRMSEILKKVDCIEVVESDKIPKRMWFIIWGSEKYQCLISTGLLPL